MAILMMILIYIFFVLYYFLVLRLIRFRFFKFSPKLVTSYRAHGKWGDLIICFIPISWCLNIISNSNLLLRILEWQGETGLLTIRIRGKQWYWVYKFELKSFIDIINTTKIIGFNKNKQVNFINMSNTSMYIIFLNKRNNYDNLKLHWTQYFYTNSYSYKYHLNYTYNFYSINYKKVNYFLESDIQARINFKFLKNLLDFFKVSKYLYTANIKPESYYLLHNYIFNLGYPINLFNLVELKNCFKANLVKKQICVSTILENLRILKKVNYFKPLTLTCLKKNVFLSEPIQVVLQVNKYQAAYKESCLLQFLVIKQKRYIPKKYTNMYDNFDSIVFKEKQFCFFKKKNYFLSSYLNNKLKNSSKLLTLNLNKRLLRTKRILILPAHLNISLITNSFDVVHSWYVPGLGIKLDCVPGRSTHHNIYISSYGFYYGQCAEICGRYHHHMPIRICALPFEHFLIWWYNYSINVYMNFTKNRLNYNYLSLRYYTW